jgi:hypothetical protein
MPKSPGNIEPWQIGMLFGCCADYGVTLPAGTHYFQCPDCLRPYTLVGKIYRMGVGQWRGGGAFDGRVLCADYRRALVGKSFDEAADLTDRWNVSTAARRCQPPAIERHLL